MRLAGFLLMPAGWAIVVAAVALLPPGAWLPVFMLAGVGIEILGLAIAARSFVAPPRDES